MSRPVGTLVGAIARRIIPAALLLLGAGTFAAAARSPSSSARWRPAAPHITTP